MKYGFFDDENKEYVISTPRTPYPWINYLGHDDFFSIISNTAGGYSFYRDARLRRLTRYRYNNVPLDDGGRYFYIKDGDTVWSAGWKPVKTELDSYECRHGLGYSKITSSKNDLQAEVTFLVPNGEHCELQKMTLKNNSGETKSIKLFSLAEFCLWNAHDDNTNFQRNFSTGEVEIKESAIYHKTEYKERRNHFSFYSVNQPIQGFETDRETFLGIYNGFDKPEAVYNGKVLNSVAHGWSPIASHYLEIILQPGESKDLVFILGYIENPDDDKWESKGVINKTRAEAIMAKYSTAEKVDQALVELKEYWQDLLSRYTLEHPDEKLSRMVNIWNQYQCMITFCMSRSASYFESGIGRGMGFRDSNQDLIGFVHQIPDKARQRIIDLAATQFPDGGAYHQYQPLTKKGNNEVGSNFNDDPPWLILATVEYIKETGDFSILDEDVPFDNDPNNSSSLFDHLHRSFYHVVNNLGPHKLPLIGRADWNDCLNLNCFSTNPDESFQTTENKKGETAESIFIAAEFILYGEEYVKLCYQIGKNQDALEAEKHIESMRQTLDQHGWDGEWFLRAYDDNGNKVGSHENEEGQIFIEPQGFCVMAGIGLQDGRAQKALDAVKEHLDCPYGIVLHNPAFTYYHIQLGEISTYPAGYKENAGIFCHNNPWIMIAETMIGRGNRAFDYYSKIAPAYLEDISDLHKTEPYVYSQMIAGKDAHKPGEAKNSWLTGTAAWNYYAITRYILGIRPTYEGLLIDPCIPATWNTFTITRKWRGANYEIKIINSAGVQKGVKSIKLNGELMTGNIIPEKEVGTTNKVEVIMQ